MRDFEVDAREAHAPDRRAARRDAASSTCIPSWAPTATWRTPITLTERGRVPRVRRLQARRRRRYTLAADLTVDGAATYAPFPRADARVETRRVLAWSCDARRRRAALRRSPATAQPVETEPYLGAGGHLVALREGDLAFLHVHPNDGDGVAFETDLEPDTRYRLYLQFQHDGRVHTAEFTR